MKHNVQMQRAYLFFRKNIGRTVTIEQLSDASEWKLSTCKTYQNKNYWQPYIIHNNKNKEMTISETFDAINEAQFRDIHSQVRSQVSDKLINTVVP